MAVSLKSNLVLHLPFLIGKSQQILVKPGNGLVEGLLLGPLLDLDRGVTANGETVLCADFSDQVLFSGRDSTYRYTAEQVDLVGLSDLPQDLLGLVTLLGWEDLVRLGGGDGKRAGDGSQLVLVDKGGVGDIADLDAVLVVADDVLETGQGRQHARDELSDEQI